jgi:hypothetical protein
VGEPSSRRSFLFGRQATMHDDWSKFVVTLRRVCMGKVKLVSELQAHLNPTTLDDVIQARRLCHEHGVVLALDGLMLSASDQSKAVLWVQAGSAWGSLIPLGDTGLWRVDAGCPMLGMQAAGLLQAHPSPSVTNLAQWFASSYRGTLLNETGLGQTLVSIDWLLPDGTIEVFGAFGAGDAQPLGSLAAQKLVPKLFELSLCPEVQAALAKPHWPFGFHLDALADVQHVNLAHFFIGHAGALGWLVAATFSKPDIPLDIPPAISSTQSDDAAAIDRQIKQKVDPDWVFMSMAA